MFNSIYICIYFHILLLEEVLVRPAGGAHPVVCVGPKAPL